MYGCGFFLYKILTGFIEIAKIKGDIELSNKYIEFKNKLRNSLNTNAWDGRWYKRAFMDDGGVLRNYF